MILDIAYAFDRRVLPQYGYGTGQTSVNLDSWAGLRYMSDSMSGATPFIESRRAARAPLDAPVRLGWINDLKRMEYLDARGIDISSVGLAVTTPQRLRISALVHLAVTGRDVVGIGRVRNCIRDGRGWRTGIELTPIP